MVLSKRIRIFDCVEDTLVRKKKNKNMVFYFVLCSLFRIFVVGNKEEGEVSYAEEKGRNVV